MKERYHLTVSKDSRSIHHTAGITEYELNFYMDTIGYMKAYEEYYTEREGLDTYLLFYTLSGEGYLKYRGQEYHLTKGTAAIISCSEHQFYRTREREWEFYYIHFYGNSADNYYRMLEENGAVFIEIADSLKFMELLKEVEHYGAESGMIADIRLANALENLFAQLLIEKINPWKDAALRSHQEAILDIQQYLQEDYRENITVEEMAERCSLSKFHFLRVFKKIVGMSPYEYLKCCRINESKRLLKETSYSISQIADLIGYGNVNIYIQNFKQCVGITPLQYRKSVF